MSIWQGPTCNQTPCVWYVLGSPPPPTLRTDPHKLFEAVWSCVIERQKPFPPHSQRLCGSLFRSPQRRLLESRLVGLPWPSLPDCMCAWRSSSLCVYYHVFVFAKCIPCVSTLARLAVAVHSFPSVHFLASNQGSTAMFSWSAKVLLLTCGMPHACLVCVIKKHSPLYTNTHSLLPFLRKQSLRGETNIR